MARITVSFEEITSASAEDGDFADTGFVQPGTGAWRSLRKGGKRMYDRNVRMSQAGRFNWSLGAALRFIDAQCCESFEGQIDSYMYPSNPDRMSVRALGEYHAREYQGRQVNYTLHIDRVSEGTIARLRRALEGRCSVRFY